MINTDLNIRLRAAGEARLGARCPPPLLRADFSRARALPGRNPADRRPWGREEAAGVPLSPFPRSLSHGWRRARALSAVGSSRRFRSPRTEFPRAVRCRVTARCGPGPGCGEPATGAARGSAAGRGGGCCWRGPPWPRGGDRGSALAIGTGRGRELNQKNSLIKKIAIPARSGELRAGSLRAR